MKRFWVIVLPVLVVTLFATLAYTKPEPPARPEHRAMEEVFAMAGSGYRLGVVLSEISPHLRDDLKITSGVKVERVLPGSAAEKAGMKDGDIILKIDGKAAESQSDIRHSLSEVEDPKPIMLDVLRDGKPMQITVTPEKRDLDVMGFGQRTYLGVDLQELDADLSGYFQTNAGSGVLVTRVEPDSPAQKGGLKSGDVITEFNGKKVTSSDDLRNALNDVKDGASANITALRHGKEQKMDVKPQKQEMRHLKELKDLQLPQVQGLMILPDMSEFRESMQGLEKEMEHLKLEMKDLHLQKEDMQKLKDEIQKEMGKFREEMKQLRKSD